MKRCSLFCAGWWPFIVFPLLLLLLFGLFQWRSVEHDVANSVKANFSNQNAEWANVSTYSRGRDVLITGVAPDDATINRLKEVALDSEGVRIVTFSGSVDEPVALDPANIEIKWQGDQVVLSGRLNDQDRINALVAQTKQTFGANRVSNQITLTDQVSDLDSINGLLPSLNVFENGNALSIVGDQLTLSGKVKSDAIKNDVGSQISALFSGNVNNSLKARFTKNQLCLQTVKSLLSTQKINFETGSAQIKANSYELLANIASVVNRCPNAKIEVAGHTDSTGSYDLNMSLSKQRAQAVLDHLAGLAVNTTELTSEGYGPNQPVASNNSSEGRAQNRRIEFKVKN